MYISGAVVKLFTLIAITSDLCTVAYIGDDVNDLQMVEAVKEAGGIIGCPADAIAKVKKMAGFTASHNGGNGVVRDFFEWMINIESSL